MASDRETADSSADRNIVNSGSDNIPLVTNKDMEQFQHSTDTQIQMPYDAGRSPYQFNFDEHPLKGYDNCGPVTGDAQGTRENNEFGDNSNERVGREALNKPGPDAPANLSPQQKEAVDGFLQGNKDHEKTHEQFNADRDVLKFLDNAEKSDEQMRKSLEGLSDKDQEGAIGAINKELAKNNQKIARAPETGDIYIGSIDSDGKVDRERRLVKGHCPTS